jgi:hypothetical protein
MFPPAGPLADLLAALPDQPSAPDPVEVFGWTLQLRGTVRVSALLDTLAAPARPAAPRPTPADDPLWRLTHIRALALRPLRSPFSGRHAVADAGRMYAALRAGGLLARRRRRDIAALAEELAGEFHRLIAARIDLARSATAELRGRVGERLRTMGPAAAYLELVDAAIREHTEERAAELFARVPVALLERFTGALWRNAQALPDEPQPADVERWYARGAWIDDHLRTCRRALAGICRHEARALEGLVAAADEVAIDMEQQT